jgi:hypothetical protein
MNTMNTQKPFFVLFRLFTKVGEYTTFDDAKKYATDKAIYNICECINNCNKIEIINRTTLDNRN